MNICSLNHLTENRNNFAQCIDTSRSNGLLSHYFGNMCGGGEMQKLEMKINNCSFNLQSNLTRSLVITLNLFFIFARLFGVTQQSNLTYILSLR